MSISDLHSSLARRLATDASPVRRLWPFSARFALWVAYVLGLCAVIVTTSCRPDIALQLRRPWFLLHVATLLAAAVALGGVALRASVPGDEPTLATMLAAGALAGAALLLGFAVPAAPAPPGEFLARGLTCVLWTAVLAAPPWVGLVVAIGRGAPLAAGAAAAFAGAAPVLLAAGVLRTACPIEERMHLLTWHLFPVCVAAGLSALVATAWLRRWRTS